ncbi:hypothetical protein CK203_006995 [Vitis vinifera]|uniref:Uncharacterized protein n=1 Tax=Vitis vinifera TaxID=29760 RepID=A0A438KCN3_VITVI|nr:hypothetical protein CK203_006995 [Vitis vinifera]
MDAVCYGPIPEGSFGKLRSLTVGDCKRLKSFISLPMEARKGSMGESSNGILGFDTGLLLHRKQCYPGVMYE